MEKAYQFINKFLAIIVISVVAAITFMVVSYITMFPHSYYERPLIFNSFWIFVIIAGLSIALAIMLERKGILKDDKVDFYLKILLAYSFIVSVVWLYISGSYPVADQSYLNLGASQMLEGNYNYFQEPNYFYKYPHQLGMVFLLNVIYRIFGQSNYFIFGMINALGVSSCLYLLYRITKLLFDNRKTEKAYIVLAFFMFPLFFYTPFIYGNIVSLLFSLGAIYLTILYMKRNKLGYQLVASLLIVIAIILKSNSLIVLLAIGLLLFVHGIKIRKIMPLIMIAVMLLFYYLGGQLISGYFENLTGTKFNNSIPKTAYIAMGLQESNRAPGWYNWYVENVYEGNAYSSEETNSQAINYIKDRVTYFSKHPVYAMKFFGEKLITIWTDPTFQGLWINNNSELTDRDFNVFNYNIFYGPINALIVFSLYVYEIVICLLASFYLIATRKKLDHIILSLGIVIVGGFFFHLIWEAKGQYTLSYYILLLPYAAAGFTEILRQVNNKLKKQVD